MYIDYMNFSSYLRASRAALDWDQTKLAQAANIGVATVRRIELGDIPNGRTQEKLERAIQKAGVIRTASGIEQPERFTLVVTDYMDVLEDADTILNKGDFIRFHCADDRKSSVEVLQKIASMEKRGIIVHSTIESGNTHLTGKSENYRWIDPDYYAASEVMAIYADRVVINAYNADISGEGEDIFLIIFSEPLAKAMTSQFEYWWKRGELPCPQ